MFPGPCTTDLRSSSVIGAQLVAIGDKFHENGKADRRGQDWAVVVERHSVSHSRCPVYHHPSLNDDGFGRRHPVGLSRGRSSAGPSCSFCQVPWLTMTRSLRSRSINLVSLSLSSVVFSVLGNPLSSSVLGLLTCTLLAVHLESRRYILTKQHGYRIAIIMNEFGDTAVSLS